MNFEKYMNEYLGKCLQDKIVNDFFVYDVSVDKTLCGMDIYYKPENSDYTKIDNREHVKYIPSSDYLFTIVDYRAFREELQSLIEERARLND